MTLAKALDLLGLTSHSTIEDARRSWRRLALRHHPDRGGREEVFKRLGAAWDLVQEHLADPEKPKETPRHRADPPATATEGAPIAVGQRFVIDYLALGGKTVEIPPGSYAMLQQRTTRQVCRDALGPFEVPVVTFQLGVHLAEPLEGGLGQVDIRVRIAETGERGSWTKLGTDSSWDRRGRLTCFAIELG